MGRDRPPAEQSDETLVERCQAKDHEAFAEMVDRYKHRVHWVVRRMVGSAEVEDLTQEVFLRVYQALPSFRQESKFSTWIYKIARNVCLSELRKQGRHGEHLALDEEGEEKIHHFLPESRKGLEEQIESRDLSERIQELIDRLPMQYRTVLTLFYVSQARYEEIAEIMNIPIGTVKTHIHRARLRLRDLLLADPGLSELIDGLREGVPGDEG